MTEAFLNAIVYKHLCSQIHFFDFFPCLAGPCPSALLQRHSPPIGLPTGHFTMIGGAT